MSFLRNVWNRYRRGDSGTVTTWVHPTDRPHTASPVDKISELTMCRACIREDGKILSTIDCWDAPDAEILKGIEQCRIIQKQDGPYLVRRNKRYEL